MRSRAEAKPSARSSCDCLSPSARSTFDCLSPSAFKMADWRSPSARLMAASLSPVDSVTRARRVRSADICRFMASCTSRGGMISRISTLVTLTPQRSVTSSSLTRRVWLMCSRCESTGRRLAARGYWSSAQVHFLTSAAAPAPAPGWLQCYQRDGGAHAETHVRRKARGTPSAAETACCNAGSPGHQERRDKRVDQAQDQVAGGEQDEPGRDQRQGDVAEQAQRTCSIDHCRVIVVSRNIMQPGQEDDETLARFGNSDMNTKTSLAVAALPSQAGAGNPAARGSLPPMN